MPRRAARWPSPTSLVECTFLPKELFDGEVKNKRQCVLKAEELNCLVGNRVISESEVLLYYETSKRDIWNSE